MSNLKPIGFANGDGGTGRGATMVRETIFKDFPTIDVLVTVQTRLGTNDQCIHDAVDAFLKCGAGFKNSTASNDPRITEAGMKSANILMRPLAGAYALLRLLQGPGRYPNMCGTLRYAHGGFYDEQSCFVDTIKGVRTAIISQHMNLDDLKPFAELAARIQKQHDLHLILSSKKTIAESELLFFKEITNTWKELGLVAGKKKDENGNIWTGHYHHELTDIALADLPIVTADGSECSNGRFLHVADNPNGDTSSDIIDLQHGNHAMGSTVYCMQNGKIFTYEELPGGTADGKTTGPLKGNKFLSPVGIILGMCSAFEQVNPNHKMFFTAVKNEMWNYLNNTAKEDRDTEVMIPLIAEKTRHLIAIEETV